MEKLEQERIVESEYGLAINNDDNTFVYPMNGIQVDKGFYTAFELKRRVTSSCTLTLHFMY